MNEDAPWSGADVTAEVRRVARRARRLGYRAVVLGNATEEHWAALRVLLEAEDVPDRVLADVVDAVLAFELDTRQVSV